MCIRAYLPVHHEALFIEIVTLRPCLVSSSLQLGQLRKSDTLFSWQLQKYEGISPNGIPELGKHLEKQLEFRVAVPLLCTKYWIDEVLFVEQIAPFLAYIKVVFMVLPGVSFCV